MFVVTVNFEVRPEFVNEFREAVLQQAYTSQLKERRCRKFDVCFDPEDRGRCFLYEQYDDRGAFEEHLESSHFAEFDKTVSSWIINKTVHVFNLANRE